MTTWIDKYLEGGLKGLVNPIRHQKPSRLTPEQQQQLKEMVLRQRPTDYGYDRNMWTGAILSQAIDRRFEVQLKDSRIYELLSELGLSYQRAHRDYANESAEGMGRDSKKNCNHLNRVNASFSLMNLPSQTVPVCSMGGQNAIPVQKCQAMRVRATNDGGLLCVDALSGEEFFRLNPKAKTEEISEYLAELCLDCVELGYTRLCLILDNNPTRKLKMQAQLAIHLEQMGLAQSIQVEFLYLPSYSPKLNARRVCDSSPTLAVSASALPTYWNDADADQQQLNQFFDSHQFLSAKQVQKTLNFIFSLIP